MTQEYTLPITESQRLKKKVELPIVTIKDVPSSRRTSSSSQRAQPRFQNRSFSAQLLFVSRPAEKSLVTMHHIVLLVHYHHDVSIAGSYPRETIDSQV